MFFKFVYLPIFVRLCIRSLLDMVKMNQRNTPLLHTYLPLSQSLLTLQLNNTPIMEGGRGIYMIVDGQKRVFPNMDTFYAFGVQVNDIMTFQSHSEFSSIPDGPPIITPASPLPPPVLPPIMAGSHAANLALQVSNAVTSVPVASSFQPSIAVKTSQTISISSQTPTVAPILAPIANPSFPSMAFVTVTQSVGSAEVYFVQSDLLRKVPDTFTATRLGYEEAVATSSTVTYSATDFQSLVSNRTYEIGAPVPTLLFAVGNADEGILAELRRIHLLYNHTLIFSAHKFGPYFNPSIYPLDLLTSAADGSRTQSVRTENVKSVNGGLAASLSRTKGNRGSVRKEKYSNLMIHRGLLWKDPQTYITVADESLTRVRILTEKSKTDEARWAAWTWDAEDRAVKTSTEGSSYVDNGELMYKAEDVRVIAPPAQTHIQLSPLQFGLGSSIRALLVYTKVLSSVRKQTFGHIELSVLSLNDTTHTFQLSPPVALEITKEINEEELSVEKNWSPFDYQGSLYFIYRFMPFIVIKVGSFNSSINIGTMELVSTTHCLTRAHATLAGDGANLPTGHVHAHHGLRQWEYGTVRGGTPALLVRDEYYLTFFHSKKAIQQELGVKRPETYFMGAYIFSAHPPFRVLRISRVPIALDEFYDGQWCQSPPIDYVVYPMSFYFSTPAGELIESSRADNTSVIVLSMGRNDIHGWSVKIRLVDLEHSLVPHHC